MSETSKHRDRFIKYTQGMGIDIGYGGAPINDTAITMDMQSMYVDYDGKPQNLFGDARHLYWFKDGVLDHVYSSHLIEDFEDTKSVLKEWIRIIRIGGYLCLLFPDEQRYRASEKPEYWNLSHKHMDMGLKYMLDILYKIPEVTVIEYAEMFDDNDYNCMIVCRKDKHGTL